MDNEKDLESLGEKLYDLIYPKHADMAPKLTGTDVSAWENVRAVEVNLFWKLLCCRNAPGAARGCDRSDAAG